MYQKLESVLKEHLLSAKRIMMASAFIKEYGYNFILQNSPEDCQKYFLVGLNLPSDINVFQNCQYSDKDNEHCHIYTGVQVFHPKVYIVEKQDDSKVAFIGSANASRGGLSENIEMSYLIGDAKECRELIQWFFSLWEKSSPIKQVFIDAYKKQLGSLQMKEASRNSDLQALKQLLSAESNEERQSHRFQFFHKEHFEAYKPEFQQDYSLEADIRRKGVWKRLVELHDLIYPQFGAKGLKHLHPHYHKPSIVSHYQRREGYTSDIMKSIWLHYGYDRSEIERGQFGFHPRIQVILHHHDLGVWLLVGRNGGSIKERAAFKSRLQNESSFSKYIFELFIKIGAAYNICIGDAVHNVSDFEDSDALANYLLIDSSEKYYVIKREFKPCDPELSESRIVDTILIEFRQLYPLYLEFKGNS